ncbi:porin [Roseateles sp.]|uniref:porin n=1 Tax=Roseateles sp. TaxID=1971397 RepID=UPI003BA6B37A
MKKIALVAAIAAFAAPAFAQSSVTLWGRVNTSVESQSVNGGDRKVMVEDNSSRLGFKGTEDLGGGLKAQFFLEHGLKSDDGRTKSAFWNREAAVQLSGNFGAVKLGRWTNGSYFATADYISMHNHDTGTSSDALYAFGTAFTETNKVGYFTPTYAGFSAEITAHAGEGADKRAFDLSANYDMGPLHLGAGYGKQGDASQFAVRGLYELGAFTFGAYYQREDVGAGARATRDIGRVSAMYALGASEFHVNVGGTKAGGTSFGARPGVNGTNGGKQYTLGYNYNLSKRTKVYGFYTAIDSTQAKSANDFDSFAVGIRHNF